jgi:low affinity Fe/Cu permease
MGDPLSTSFSERFHRLARAVSNAVGSPWAAASAAAVVIFWALSGPYFQYSEDWQLVINTGTTIVTFLMVFLIQHTQNRESRELQMKLNELIRSVSEARNKFISLEDMTDHELDQFQAELKQLASKYRFEPIAEGSALHQEIEQARQRRKRRSADHVAVKHNREKSEFDAS